MYLPYVPKKYFWIWRIRKKVLFVFQCYYCGFSQIYKIKLLTCLKTFLEVGSFLHSLEEWICLVVQVVLHKRLEKKNKKIIYTKSEQKQQKILPGLLINKSVIDDNITFFKPWLKALLRIIKNAA